MKGIFKQILFNRRPLIMLTAMLFGILFYKPIYAVDNLSGNRLAPLLIFSMLFVTFCRVRLRDLHFSKLQLWLILFQLVVTPLSYYLFLPFGEVMAQGIMISFMMPIAMGAVAIGALLGANIITLASYSLVCNIIIAFVGPLFLNYFGNGECTLADILNRVAPLLLTPLIAAQLLKYTWRSAAEWIGRHSQMSFYMWLFSMIVTLGRTTSYIMEVKDDLEIPLVLALSGASLLASIVQYRAGAILGRIYSDKVAGAQSLGQKNTVLGVWLAHTFLNPVSSIAPTAYIIWQNLFNSLHIYQYDRENNRNQESAK